MDMRTLVVASLVVVGGAWALDQTNIASAQACNVPPNRPTSASATRAADGSVVVTWSASGGCAATRFYLEASRGVSEVVEETVEDGTDRSAALALGAANGTPWRISVRGFNEFGLSSGRSAVLSEGTPVGPPNPCPSGELPPPTLVSANAVGRTLFVQWQPDSRCLTAVTNYVIAGSQTPDGPILGTVTVPYPNARSWSGEVPPGSYYVKVITQYYSMSSPPSASLLVHVQ